MGWIALWAIVTAVGAAGTVASANGVRFRHRIEREARELSAAAREPRRIDRAPTAALPAPVQRYLNIVLGDRSRAIGRVRLRHGGLFRPSLDGSWLPIRGEQYFTTDPPGFVWWGRVRLAPGVWIDARDRSVNGVGNMYVTLESSFTIADSRGREIDEGALTRLLGETAWFPTAFLDDRFVRWAPVDDRRARATLSVGGRSVTADFAFGDDGLPEAFTAARYRDVGGGKAVLTPFVGRITDFRRVEDVLVPFRATAAWIVDGTPIEYARFDVEEIAFDAATPAPRQD